MFENTTMISKCMIIVDSYSYSYKFCWSLGIIFFRLKLNFFMVLSTQCSFKLLVYQWLDVYFC